MDSIKNQYPEKSLKILFFGTSDFAVPALKYLIQNGHNIVGVVTQSEKPAGRLRLIIPSPIKKAALEAGLDVFEPHSLKKDEQFFKKFKHIEPDVCIIAAYGKIVSAQYLELPRFGFINIHPSVLPKYRGPSPIQTAIMNGDEETGVTIMKIDEKVDHGPILGNIKYKLTVSKGFKDIQRELAELGGQLLLEVLPKYISGEIKPEEQDHANATFTKMLMREDGKIDWHKTAEEINNQVMALNPEPGTWTTWNGKILNLKKSEFHEPGPEKIKAGTVIRLSNKEIAVATKKCYLILKQIQLEGGKEMDARSFLNGHPDFLGSELE